MKDLPSVRNRVCIRVVGIRKRGESSSGPKWPRVMWSWNVLKRPLQCLWFVYPVLPHTHRCAYIQKEMEFPRGFQTCVVTPESEKVLKIDSLEAKIRVWHPFVKIWGALGGLRGGGSGFRTFPEPKLMPLGSHFWTVFRPGPPKSAKKYRFFVIQLEIWIFITFL